MIDPVWNHADQLQVKVLTNLVLGQLTDLLVVQKFGRNGEYFLVQFAVDLWSQIWREHFEDWFDEESNELLVGLVVEVPQELEPCLRSELLAFFDDDFFEKGDVFEQVLNNYFMNGLNLGWGYFLYLLGIFHEL